LILYASPATRQPCLAPPACVDVVHQPGPQSAGVGVAARRRTSAGIDLLMFCASLAWSGLSRLMLYPSLAHSQLMLLMLLLA